MDSIVPNANPHLVVLQVWASRADGLEDVHEFPIIAWRLVEGEAPIPISTDGEPNSDDARDWMVFDRATDRGYSPVSNTHTRQKCIEELQDTIAARRARKATA